MKQDSTSSSVKLSKKQKEVIGLMRDGYVLHENAVTPGAKWSLTKDGDYKWGNVSGHVINKILPLLSGRKKNWGVNIYTLSELGRSIKL